MTPLLVSVGYPSDVQAPPDLAATRRAPLRPTVTTEHVAPLYDLGDRLADLVVAAVPLGVVVLPEVLPRGLARHVDGLGGFGSVRRRGCLRRSQVLDQDSLVGGGAAILFKVRQHDVGQ